MAVERDTIFVLRKLVVDALVFGALGLGFYVTSHWFNPYQRGFFCGDESLMYPYKDSTVSGEVLHAVGLSLPILTIVICELAQLRGYKGGRRVLFGWKIPAWLLGCYCVLTSFIFGVLCIEFTTSIAKFTIGRLRPMFFAVCVPSVDCSMESFRGRYVEPHEYTCTGSRTHEFRDIRLSFLSGHSSWAAYTMIYLALYLQKRMTWSGTKLMRQLLQFSVLMLSWFTALSRVSDFKHHWSDVLAGYCAGAIMAVLIFKWGTQWVKRKEHSPLPQHELYFNPGVLQSQVCT